MGEYTDTLRKHLKPEQYYQFVWVDKDNFNSTEVLLGMFVNYSAEELIFKNIVRYSAIDDIVYSVLIANDFSVSNKLVEKYGDTFTVSKSSATIVAKVKHSIKTTIKL